MHVYPVIKPMSKRGRKSLYLDTLGELVKPPIGKDWDTRTSANSPAGWKFRRLASEGHINPTDTPYFIWQKFPQLRVVNPHNGNWRKFVINCKKVAFPKHTKMSTMSRSSSSDGDDPSENEYDDEESNVDTTETLNRQRPDPSTNGQKLGQPLTSRSMLQNRDSPHHGSTRIIPTSDRTATMVFVNVAKGTKASDIRLIRDNSNKGKFTFYTRSVLENEYSIEEMLSMLHPNDPYVRDCKAAMVRFNGVDAPNDMNKNPPLDMMTIDLGCDHEAVLGTWVGMGKNGKSCEMPGMFISSCGRVCIMFFRKLDDKRGTVNSVSPNPYAATASSDSGGGSAGSDWQQQQQQQQQHPQGHNRFNQGQGVGGNGGYVRLVTYLV